MPTKTTGYLANGVLYATLAQAQVAEMLAVLKQTDGSGDMTDAMLERMAVDLVNGQRDALLAILTTGPTSRPGARRKAGTSNPKRAAAKAAKATTKAEKAHVEDVTGMPFNSAAEQAA